MTMPTKPFYVAPNRFVVRRGSTLEISPSGLAGKKVGVRRGTVQDRFVSATYPAAKIQRYADLSELYIDLALGRLDTVMATAKHYAAYGAANAVIRLAAQARFKADVAD